MKERMDRILKQCKFSKRHRGYQELQECIRIAVDDEARLLHMTGIYTEVAGRFQITWSGVERNIRTAFDYAWVNGGKEQMEQLSGSIFYGKPTIGEVIETLACYIKEHSGEFDYNE